MSYRTLVNDIQVFGNNEYYPEWIEFIKSQGIAVNEDGYYEGDITDFMGALSVIEQIVLRLNKEQEERNQKRREHIQKLSDEQRETLQKSGFRIQSLFDFRNIPEFLEKQDEFSPNDRYNSSLLDQLFETVNQSYAFMPYTFYKACEDKLEEAEMFSTDGHLHCFKVKNGEKIHVRAR